MGIQQVADQIRGILARNGVEYAQNESGTGFQVRYGSASVFVDISKWVDDSLLIDLLAWVLLDVELDARREVEILRSLNARNRRGAFGCLSLDYDQNAIALEHSLLADDLDGSELMNALLALSTRADRLDDELQEEFGTGRRWFELEQQQRDQAAPTMWT